nr:hypothetical protein CFP56_23981 [Quercus suber]
MLGKGEKRVAVDEIGIDVSGIRGHRRTCLDFWRYMSSKLAFASPYALRLTLCHVDKLGRYNILLVVLAGIHCIGECDDVIAECETSYGSRGLRGNRSR